MSNLATMDVMLGAYSRNELESNSEDRNVEVDIESDKPRQDMIQNTEDFRSLLNSNSSEISEATMETTRLINSDVSTRSDELKRDLSSQIME